jgi:hypothetical protein
MTQIDLKYYLLRGKVCTLALPISFHGLMEIFSERKSNWLILHRVVKFMVGPRIYDGVLFWSLNIIWISNSSKRIWTRTRLHIRLDEYKTQIEFKEENGTFSEFGTGVTHLYKFEDWPWTLLLYFYLY